MSQAAKRLQLQMWLRCVFGVHLHQPVPSVRQGEILRAAVPLVWFGLGYIVCLLTRL